MYISSKWSVASYSQCSAYSRLLQSYGNVSVLSMVVVLGTSLSMRKLEGQAMLDVIREVAGMSGSHGFFLLVKPRKMVAKTKKRVDVDHRCCEECWK